jgi:hypothetical protein
LLIQNEAFSVRSDNKARRQKFDSFAGARPAFSALAFARFDELSFCFRAKLIGRGGTFYKPRHFESAGWRRENYQH